MRIFNNLLSAAGATATMGLVFHQEHEVAPVVADRRAGTRQGTSPGRAQSSETAALLATGIATLALGTLLVVQVATSLQMPSLV